MIICIPVNMSDEISGRYIAQVQNMSGDSIAAHLTKLLAMGANPSLCAKYMLRDDVCKYLDKLLAAGADPNICIENMHGKDIFANLYKLLGAGADINFCVEKAWPENIPTDFDRWHSIYAGVYC